MAYMKVELLMLVLAHARLAWSTSPLFSYGSGDTLPPSDDGFSDPITQTSSFPFYGTNYNVLFVCNNGIISFGEGIASFTPTAFPIADNPVIAPFWADVDTRGSGTVYFRELVGSALTEVTDAVTAVDAYAGFSATWGYLVTWHQVPPYNYGNQYNTFQAALAMDGAHSYVVFNYGDMVWTHGSASGGIAGQVGFDAGDYTNSYAHPDSRSSQIADIETGTNVDFTGRYIYRVDQAEIVAADDECGSNPCLHGGACTDGDDSYTCSCASGYQGTNCETDVDECASSLCQNSATCNDGANAYTCTCVSGYVGTNCETDIDECASTPCQNSATCNDGVNAYTCTCVSGYGGTNCETDIDECASSPCQNSATCNDGVNAYTCTCVSGYGGAECEVGACEAYYNASGGESFCSNNGMCVNIVAMTTNGSLTGEAVCECTPDFEGDQCQTGISERRALRRRLRRVPWTSTPGVATIATVGGLLAVVTTASFLLWRLGKCKKLGENEEEQGEGRHHDDSQGDNASAVTTSTGVS